MRDLIHKALLHTKLYNIILSSINQHVKELLQNYTAFLLVYRSGFFSKQG